MTWPGTNIANQRGKREPHAPLHPLPLFQECVERNERDGDNVWGAEARKKGNLLKEGNACA